MCVLTRGKFSSRLGKTCLESQCKLLGSGLRYSKTHVQNAVFRSSLRGCTQNVLRKQKTGLTISYFTKLCMKLRVLWREVGRGRGGGWRLRRRGVRINFRRLSILSLCDVLNKGIRGFICIILHFIYSSLKIALFFLFK